MRKQNAFLFLPLLNFPVSVYIGLYRSTFIAGSVLISKYIIRMLSFCGQTIYRIFHCLSDTGLLTGNHFRSQPLHQTAVVGLDSTFFPFFSGTDHIAWYLMCSAQIRQYAAQIRTAVTVYHHTVFSLCQHICIKCLANSHFIPTKRKWQKIFSFTI